MSGIPVAYLARHGETAWTITGQHTGRTDLPLTERGECNARSLGKRLEGLEFARVFTSPLRYAGRLISRRIRGKPALPPFRYFDKGNMAIVGKGFAVLETGAIKVSGFLAWLAWAAVHLEFLAQSNFGVSVFIQWVWTYLTGKRGSRLIVNHRAYEPFLAAKTAHVVGSDKQAIRPSCST